MSVQHQKVKSVAKRILTAGNGLNEIALKTMKTISDVVGSTLGPGGRGVLLERYEYDSPVFVTKDGVTVFKALGFKDSIAHAIMECFRDSSARTAQTAGDGTTTAAVFGAELSKQLHEFCEDHPKVSPQRAIRELERLFTTVVEPCLKEIATFPKLGEEAGDAVLQRVARMSANGDDPLAKAVMECYAVSGDAGHVTINELSGPSRYEVEAINGFPIHVGYEDSCGVFYPKFINDQSHQQCALDRPVFLLYHGEINDPHVIFRALALIGDENAQRLNGEGGGYDHNNVVVVATGFSERVLGMFAANAADPIGIFPFPLSVPKSPFSNGQKQFLDDLAAVTGAKVFDPISFPLETAALEDFGPGVDRFEATRWRSMVYGRADEDALLERVADLQVLADNPESEMDQKFTQERIGKLTGGIAKLKIYGGSNAETREKKDRADDAVCAVRGAIKHGCIPGGGWGLLRAYSRLNSLDYDDCNLINWVAGTVLSPALRCPVERLLENAGYLPEEYEEIVNRLVTLAAKGDAETFDVLSGEFVKAYEAGVLDSLPAVVEAIRNGISSAAVIGTLGAVVVFERDQELERDEAKAIEDFKRNATEENPADERP